MPPSWLDESRAAALEIYEREEVPTWRRSGFWTTSLRGLDLDALEPRRYEAVAEPPEIVGPQEDLAALIVQRGGSTVYAWVGDERITVMPLEQAAEEHSELVQRWFAKRLPAGEGKFEAANAAFWTGGAFIHVPRGVVVDKPIQVIYEIEDPGTAQYARTLGIVEENAEARIREYCVAPDFEGQALHAGAFELYLEQGANVKLAHFQDWGSGEVHDISVKRVEIARDALCTWVPIHLGGKLTKQTLDIITAEQGADMRHYGLYFTENDEHLDLFTTDLKEAGPTSGDTIWKGALTGASRASYEGLIQINKGAQDTHTYLQTHSMLLSPKAKGDSIPSLIVETDNVSASHGGTVGELDEELVFYMQTRGLTRAEAMRILVEGYFEPVVQKIEDDQLEEIVRGRIAEKLTAASDEVAQYIEAR
ncbi:MAG: SufD family Fe-S cluster assembly protein [Thermoleophilaceae bacterium]|nr:SufD family Fe-S cluster assembly protein [Thermoleophilaceae bacterium]